MKQNCFVLTLMVLLFVGCMPDFDPQTDSDQRNATFRFDTERLSEGFLTVGDDNMVLGGSTITENQRIRISVFCYDTNGTLLDKATVFACHGESPSVTMRHLMKNAMYHFIFFADIVEYENDIDFIEHWFHISYQQINRFYIKLIGMGNGFDFDEQLWHFDTLMTVENRTYSIPLKLITHNGYVTFVETDDLEGLVVTVTCHTSLTVSPLSGKILDAEGYELSTPAAYKQWSGFVVPNIDSVINLAVVFPTEDGSDTIKRIIPNPDTRPFTVSFNCKTKEIEEYDFY